MMQLSRWKFFNTKYATIFTKNDEHRSSSSQAVETYFQDYFDFKKLR